jgi:hypothetical protein
MRKLRLRFGSCREANSLIFRETGVVLTFFQKKLGLAANMEYFGGTESTNRLGSHFSRLVNPVGTNPLRR